MRGIIKLTLIGAIVIALVTSGVILYYADEALAAGTVTVTEERIDSVKKISFAWVSNGSGAADGSTTYYYNGEVLRFVFIPSPSVTPTALYDVTMKDSDGVDIFDGEGSNLSASTSYQVQGLANFSAVANTKLTLAVTNAGDSKQGTVIVYIR